MPKGIYNRNKSARRRISTKGQTPLTDEQVMERKALSALTSAAMSGAVEKARLNKRLDHIEALLVTKAEEARKITEPALGEGALSLLASKNFRLTGDVGNAQSAIESMGRGIQKASAPTEGMAVGSLILSIERISYERGLTEGRLNAKILELSIVNQELLAAVRRREEDEAKIDGEFQEAS